MSPSRSVLLIVSAVVLGGPLLIAVVTGIVRAKMRDEDAGKPMSVAGTYIHRGSGIEFPEAVGAFKRAAPRQYDEKGDDVGIGYERSVDGAPLEATVFVFPPSPHPDGRVMSAEEQFESEVVEKRSGKAELRDGTRHQVEATYAGKPVTVRFVDFDFRSESPFGLKSLRVAALLVSIRAGDWHLTYMATVAVEHRDAAWAAVEELVRALGLPSMGFTATPR